LLFESKSPFFPRDHPECPLHLFELSEECLKLKKRYESTPSGRRVNYAKKGFPSPFNPDWSLIILNLGGSGRHPIVMTSKHSVAIIEKNLKISHGSFDDLVGSIYIDLKKLTNQRDINTELTNLKVGTLNFLFCRVVIQLDKGQARPHSQIHLAYEANFELDSIVDASSIVGYTTSGGFSLTTGKSQAIGIISLKSLFCAFKKDYKLWIRCPYSRMSRECTFNLSI
jgi:hypothetical protein